MMQTSAAQRSIILALLAIVTTIAIPATCARAAFIVDWNGPNDGDGDFNTLCVSFFPFEANQLSFIEGEGYSHNQGNLPLQYGIEIRLDNLWVEIDSWNHQDALHHLLTERTNNGPLKFAAGVIDGLRLKSSEAVYFGYHDLRGTSFTFDNDPPDDVPPVPEPSSILLLGTGAMGLMVARRFRARLKSD